MGALTTTTTTCIIFNIMGGEDSKDANQEPGIIVDIFPRDKIETIAEQIEALALQDHNPNHTGGMLDLTSPMYKKHAGGYSKKTGDLYPYQIETVWPDGRGRTFKCYTVRQALLAPVIDSGELNNEPKPVPGRLLVVEIKIIVSPSPTNPGSTYAKANYMMEDEQGEQHHAAFLSPPENPMSKETLSAALDSLSQAAGSIKREGDQAG